MQCYHYDGSFAGFLTVLALLEERRATPSDFCATPHRQGLFDTHEQVATEPERALAYLNQLETRFSTHTRHLVEQAFCAEAPGREILIYRFLELGRHEGRRFTAMLAHPQITPVLRLARQVSREAHRYLGLVRFREVTGGFYYAQVEPEHLILPWIAPHFAARFHDQHWVIHDLNRNLGAVYDAGHRERRLVPLELTTEPADTDNEAVFVALWQRYFERLSIPERHNPKLQQGNLPLKHRAHLQEFAADSRTMLTALPPPARISVGSNKKREAP